MTFLNPAAFVLAALAIPIILLYMLRLRRREVVVSSHFLWRQVLRDNAANTPWQRLRRNLFLLLQLIILALLVVAFARPTIAVPTVSAGRVAVLLDASASMNATDTDNGTRWQAAQAQALSLVEQMGIGDEMLVLRVGDTVEALSEYSSDTAQLRSAINAAQAGQGGADWDTAFTLAVAGAAGNDDFRTFIISDGSSGTLSQVVLPASVPQPRLIPIGRERDNLAIAALAVRATVGGNRQIFAQVRHYGEGEVRFSLTLRLDGMLWVSEEATLAADSTRSFVFDAEQNFGTVEARLVLPSVRDYLPQDNTAYAVAPNIQTRRVLLVSADPARYLAQVLAVLPNVQVVQGDPNLSELPTGEFDGYLFEGYLPTTLPNADMLIVNPPRSSRLFTLGAFSDQTQGIEVIQPDHPLLTYADFSAVNLRELRTVESDLLQPVIVAEGGALLWAVEQDGQQIALMPFQLSGSDLPLQITFPIFAANLLEWFTPQTRLTPEMQLAVSAPITLTLPLNATNARITAPDGTQATLTRDESYTQTATTGFYLVEALQDGRVLLEQAIAVNLFDERESNLTPLTDVPMSGTAIAEDANRDLSLRELTGWFALVAMLILLLEWWLYHRQFRLVRRVG
jgi:hypothetical protein